MVTCKDFSTKTTQKMKNKNTQREVRSEIEKEQQKF